MDIGSKTWQSRRRSRPAMESLEARALLSGSAAGLTSLQDPTSDVATAGPITRLSYLTTTGARVVIQLFGAGNLAGTTVDATGLNLRFSGTNMETGIIATVRGGGGRAPLESVESLNTPPGSLSGVGSSLINLVNLKGFDLVSGGRINLTGGVHLLTLNAVAGDTQINLRELPETPGSPVVGGVASLKNPLSVTSLSSSTTNSTTAAGVVFPSTATQNGQTLSFAYDSAGGQTLSGVSGVFVPGTNIVPQNIEPGSPNPQPGMPPGAPGVKIQINQVNGPSGSAGLGDAQIFGYDATTNQLIRFDTANGNPTATIDNALPASSTAAGVALAQVNGTTLVLISDGSNVFAYNANDGTSAGHFSLGVLGLANPTRLGTFDNNTVIVDPAGGVNGLGLLQPIDVAASLSTQVAQPMLNAQGNPVPAYSMTNAFGLSGGVTGVPGLDTLYAAGGAHFDTFQPTQFQLGIASLNQGNSGMLNESSRNEVSDQKGNATVTDSFGATLSGASLNNALGSLGQNLALVTGQTLTPAGEVDTVTLYNPVSFSAQGTFVLNDADPLTGLSGAFYPTLAGAALVDVQGNTQSFKANSATGLVFSGEGNVGLVQIQNAADTEILGFPFGHAAIPNRSNVTIVSSTRTVGSRNGVTELPGINPTGPLSLPTA